MTKNLRQYLDGHFEKESLDQQLQKTIRDNLYMRTIPCNELFADRFLERKRHFDLGTTRPPRPGEVNGQDYIFLTLKDFRALEKSGNLVESGVYQGKGRGGRKRRTALSLFLSVQVIITERLDR